jgi:hypothetical protein
MDQLISQVLLPPNRPTLEAAGIMALYASQTQIHLAWTQCLLYMLQKHFEAQTGR